MDAGYDEGRARRVLLIGLAALWLADGVLQLQPAMFTPRMAKWLWAAAAQGNPPWLAGLVSWSVAVARPWLPAFNALLAGTQVALGGSLLAARRPAARAAALWGSLLFALGVWVFGEGMGGLLAGGPSLLVGAPGSALLYAAASAVLLLPQGSWQRAKARWGVAPVQAVVIVALSAGALWQFPVSSWADPLGLSAVPAANVMMPQPGALRAVVAAASGVAVGAPLLTNALLVASLLAAAAGVALAGRRTWVLGGILGLLGVLWVCGQDAGMLFSGVATDPNTMPLLALFVCAHWAAAARPRPAGGGRQLLAQA
jgi:hypothetical protein